MIKIDIVYSQVDYLAKFVFVVKQPILAKSPFCHVETVPMNAACDEVGPFGMGHQGHWWAAAPATAAAVGWGSTGEVDGVPRPTW